MAKLSKSERTFNKLVDVGVYNEVQRNELCKSPIMIKEPLYKYYNLEEKIDSQGVDLKLLSLLENGKITYDIFSKYVVQLNYFINKSNVDGFLNQLSLNIDNDCLLNSDEIDYLFYIYKNDSLKETERLDFLDFLQKTKTMGVSLDKKGLITFYNRIRDVDYPITLGKHTYDDVGSLLEMSPFSLINEYKVKDWKYHEYLDYVTRVENMANLFYVMYIDSQYDYGLTYDELRFLYLEARYTDFYNKEIYMDFMGKNLTKNKLYKTSMLLSRYDFDYETLNKNIYSTILGEMYFKEYDLMALGDYILEDEIDSFIAYLTKPKKKELIIDSYSVKFLDIEESDILEKDAVFVVREWGKNLNLIAYFRDVDTDDLFKVNIYKNFDLGIYGTESDFRNMPENSLVRLKLERNVNKKSGQSYTKVNGFELLERNVFIDDVMKYDIY